MSLFPDNSCISDTLSPIPAGYCTTSMKYSLTNALFNGAVSMVGNYLLKNKRLFENAAEIAAVSFISDFIDNRFGVDSNLPLSVLYNRFVQKRGASESVAEATMDNVYIKIGDVLYKIIFK